jgi:hypothetical protein
MEEIFLTTTYNTFVKNLVYSKSYLENRILYSDVKKKGEQLNITITDGEIMSRTDQVLGEYPAYRYHWDYDVSTVCLIESTSLNNIILNDPSIILDASANYIRLDIGKSTSTIKFEKEVPENYRTLFQQNGGEFQEPVYIPNERIQSITWEYPDASERCFITDYGMLNMYNAYSTSASYVKDNNIPIYSYENGKWLYFVTITTGAKNILKSFGAKFENKLT